MHDDALRKTHQLALDDPFTKPDAQPQRPKHKAVTLLKSLTSRMQRGAGQNRHIRKIRDTKRMTPKLGLIALLPGDLVCDWLKIHGEESRFLFRMFVNLSVYGKIAVALMLPFI